MAGFTLMVMVWVGIVRAAKGKVMTSKVSGLCSGGVRGISGLIYFVHVYVSIAALCTLSDEEGGVCCGDRVRGHHRTIGGY